MFLTSLKQTCNEYLIKFSENQSAPKLENMKTSPCSPCAPNLLHVLVSRIPGYHNLCSPALKQSQIFYSLVLLPLGFRLVIPKSLKGIVFPHRGNFRYRKGLVDIKMLLNVPQVSSAKFRKTFHEAMNQARNAPGGAKKSTVCFGKISGLGKSLLSTKWVGLIDGKCKRLSQEGEFRFF